MGTPRRGSEEGQRIVDAITQATRDRILARTIEAAKCTANAAYKARLFSPAYERLTAHIDDQCNAIAGMSGLDRRQVAEFIQGRDMAQAIRMSERVGRAVLLRLGYQLPEEVASE